MICCLQQSAVPDLASLSYTTPRVSSRPSAFAWLAICKTCHTKACNSKNCVLDNASYLQLVRHSCGICHLPQHGRSQAVRVPGSQPGVNRKLSLDFGRLPILSFWQTNRHVLGAKRRQEPGSTKKICSHKCGSLQANVKQCTFSDRPPHRAWVSQPFRACECKWPAPSPIK